MKPANVGGSFEREASLSFGGILAAGGDFVLPDMLFEVEDENKDACSADGSFNATLSAEDGRGGGA